MISTRKYEAETSNARNLANNRNFEMQKTAIYSPRRGLSNGTKCIMNGVILRKLSRVKEE